MVEDVPAAGLPPAHVGVAGRAGDPSEGRLLRADTAVWHRQWLVLSFVVIAGSVPLGLDRGRRWRPAPTRRANMTSEVRLGADSCTRCVNEELSRERIGLGELGIGIILHRYGKSMAACR